MDSLISIDQKQSELLSFHIPSKNKLINIDVIEEINENDNKKKDLQVSTKKRKLKKMLHTINLNNLEVPFLGDAISSSNTIKSSSMNNLKVRKLQIPEKNIGEQNFYSVYEKGRLSNPSFTFISPRNKKSRSIYDASKSKRLHYSSCQQVH